MVTTPYFQQDPETIRRLFGSIARRYDLGNALTSLGLHHLWNRYLIQTALAAAPHGPLLDLCAGTGAIGLGYLRHAPHASVALLDFCPQMLDIARLRTPPGCDVVCLEADAHDIPLHDASVACVTTAYGIRNVANPKTCANEVHRVLASGGSWIILELTRPHQPWLRTFHKAYLNTVLPLIGGMLTGNRKAYRYLAGSIYSFPDLTALFQERFHIKQKKILAGGIAALLELKKNS